MSEVIMPPHSDKQEPIAIVGAACRLAGGVSSLGSLWDMASKAKSGHCKVPPERWDADFWHHPSADRKGSIVVKHGYFLKHDVAAFDAPFFSVTAKEAAAMDPMKRHLLEVSYESIEDAGIPFDTLMNSKSGCYVGCMTNDYEMNSLHDIYDLGHAAASATSEAMIANRVSHFFGMRGPSLTLDTACSSSLYALHLACQSLRVGETNLGLVAGVNLILIPNTMHQLSAMHMLSPEGVSHTFDDRANGYGRGEGIGSLIIKRLSDAIRDGDTIRAVIRGTGVNADGKTASVTQPSAEAQAELINDTYEAAGLSQEHTQYFECHGTGTPVGDPIELEAISRTIAARRREAGKSPLYIGSVKPNVGHTEGCSGLAGVFKSIGCLEKGLLVPVHGLQTVNPKLRLSDWHLEIPSEVIRWAPGPRRVSVNSFGFGGANAHAILDDAYHYLHDRGLGGRHNTEVEDSRESDSGISSGSSSPRLQSNDRRLFVFSSKDQAGIQRLGSSWAAGLSGTQLDKQDPRYLSDLSWTLAARRSHLDFRSSAVASSLEELVGKLETGLPKYKRSSRQDRNLIFVCTGQGAQWPGMGKELLSEEVFQTSVITSQAHLSLLGCQWNVVEELTEGANSRINHPEFSQTLCTVLQVALIDLLRHWKVLPLATVGHSSGEIAAAYAAGYITHSDAVKIAYIRGLCSASVPRQGAMLAAGLGQDEALRYLARFPEDAAVVACVNSPSSVTLSGDIEAIEGLEKMLSADNKFARKLKVHTAYHSPHMRDVADNYLEKMERIVPTTDVDSGTIMYSSLTGNIVDPKELTEHYWMSNMCAPVQFCNAVQSLLSHTTAVPGRQRKMPVRWGGIVELGPHAALQGPVQQNIAEANSKSAKEATYLSMVLRNRDASETAIQTAAQLWCLGHDVSLTAVNRSERTSKCLTDLPSYSWNHGKTFWHETYLTKSNRFPPEARTDLLGVAEDLSTGLEPRWRNHLRLTESPWIEDHKITGTILYPGAGMLIMALEGALRAARQDSEIHGFRFRDVEFLRGLVVPSSDESAVETRLHLSSNKHINGEFRFTVSSTTTGSWTKHCTGTIAVEHTATKPSQIEDLAMTNKEWSRAVKAYQDLKEDCSAETVDVDEFYDHLETIGMEYGPLFRNVEALTTVPACRSAYASITVPDTKSAMPFEFEFPHVMHPATMDAIFHLLLAAFNEGRPIEDAAVPYRLDHMFVAADQPKGVGSRFLGYGTQVKKSADGHEVVGDLIVSDDRWSAPKLVVKGFALRQVSGEGDEQDASVLDGYGTSKCARISWMEDIDFVHTAEQVASFRKPVPASQDPAGRLASWLDRLTHKGPLANVLVILCGLNSRAAGIFGDLHSRHNQERGFRKIKFVSAREGEDDAFQSQFPGTSGPQLHHWSPTGESGIAGELETFDLAVIVGEDFAPELLTQVRARLNSSSHMILGYDNLGVELCDMLQDANMRPHITFSETGRPTYVVTSTPATSLTSARPSEVVVLLPEIASAEVKEMSQAIMANLSAMGLQVVLATFAIESASQLAGKSIISLVEVETPFVYSWNEASFDAFKNLVSSAAHMFWLTRGAVLQDWLGGIQFAPTQGLLRVLRNEYPSITLPHLDLSAGFDLLSPRAAQLVLEVWGKALPSDAEMEYAELDGIIHIPRAVQEVGLDEELQLAAGTAKPLQRLLHGEERALKLTPSIYGTHALWAIDEEAHRALGNKEVEVEVEVVGLRKAASPLDRAREAVGVVRRCGEQVQSVRTGQRVVLFGNQVCHTLVRQVEDLVCPAPARMSSGDIAAVATDYITAQYALLEIGRVEHGSTVVVLSAGSSVGQAAVHVAKSAGAKVFALVDSEEQKNFLVETHGIATERVYDSSLLTFLAGIQWECRGQGVDLILNSENCAATFASAALLADFGMFIDLCSVPGLALLSSRRNASLIRVEMEEVFSAKARLVQTLLRRTFETLLYFATAAPISAITSFSAADACQAFDALEKSSHGKVVLSLHKDATVLTARPVPAHTIDGDATYVLAGGLGALGLDISNMMIQHGARNLCFLSRSGGNKNFEDLESFRARGVNVQAFKCDVNDINSVKKVFGQLRSQGHVVRGVIQAAMVLEDAIFENMSHAQWQRAITPKIHGSRNLLDNLLAEDSPFFILLSSITGIIGNAAQSNYAAGNTFEDALAHYARSHLSIAATSIDVGLVADSSHFTAQGEFGDIQNYLGKYGHGWQGMQTSLQELRVAILAVIRGDLATGPQFVLGLGNNVVREEGSMGFQNDKKFSLRTIERSASGGGAAKSTNIADSLRAATSQSEAATAVEGYVKQQISNASGIEVEEVDVHKPLYDFGVDSLKAVELRSRAAREMQSEVSVFEILGATPVVELSGLIASRSKLVEVTSDGADE